MEPRYKAGAEVLIVGVGLKGWNGPGTVRHAQNNGGEVIYVVYSDSMKKEGGFREKELQPIYDEQELDREARLLLGIPEEQESP